MSVHDDLLEGLHTKKYADLRGEDCGQEPHERLRCAHPKRFAQTAAEGDGPRCDQQSRAKEREEQSQGDREDERRNDVRVAAIREISRTEPARVGGAFEERIGECRRGCSSRNAKKAAERAAMHGGRYGVPEGGGGCGSESAAAMAR